MSQHDNISISHSERVKQQILNWCILIAVILAIIGAVNLFRYLTRTTSISATPLPCYDHQDVTVFRDGVLYYDGEYIHYVGANGSVIWSHAVGSNASFSVSDTHIVAWQGDQLHIIDARGKASYNEPVYVPIQFARIGSRYAVAVTGSDEMHSTLMVRDLTGSVVDNERDHFDGMFLLDCGFYGGSDQYMWAMAYDVFNPTIATFLFTYEVGSMDTGSINLGEHLAYKVVYADNDLNVFTTQQMYAYDYKGVQHVDDTMLVYGWKYLAHDTPERGSTQFLLAPTAQTNSEQSITELRVFSDDIDRRYTLPSACVGAGIDNGRIYGISNNYLYAGSVGSQRFIAHDMNLPDDRIATGFIGLTDNGYAIIISDHEVYSVSLPK